MSQRIFTENFLIQQYNNLRGAESTSYVNHYKGSTWKDDKLPSNAFTTMSIPPVTEFLGEKMMAAFASDATADFHAGKILFEALKHLTPRQASNPGLWSYLQHFDLFGYVKLRWPDIENPPMNSSPESYILNHWLQTKSAQADLMDYPLSGLWWAFYISETPERNDPYELTKILFQNFSFRTKYFGQSKVARHKEAVIGTLQFIKDNNLHLNNSEDNGRAVTTYVNLLGGIKPLSYFNWDWFYKQLTEKFSQDIRNFGRLYSRDERPENPILAPVVIEERQEEEVEKLTEIKVSETVIYFNLFDNGVNYLTEGIPRPGARHFLPITEENENGHLYLFYDNGKINKVPVQLLLENKFDKKFYNGKYSGAHLVKIQIIKNEALILIMAAVFNLGRCFKIFRTEWIESNDKLNHPGEMVSPFKKDFSFAVLPNDLEKNLEAVIMQNSKSFKSSLNKEYEKEWEIVKKYL